MSAVFPLARSARWILGCRSANRKRARNRHMRSLETSIRPDELVMTLPKRKEATGSERGVAPEIYIGNSVFFLPVCTVPDRCRLLKRPGCTGPKMLA